MNPTVKIITALVILMLLVSNYSYKNQIAKLKKQLNDPEYCIEQCSMAFEIMGC